MLNHLISKVIGCVFTLCVLLSQGSSFAATVPTGYQETVAVSGLNQPTCMAWVPDLGDGNTRMLVTCKTGAIRVVKNGALLGTNFAMLSPYTNSECGVLSVIYHPNFATAPAGQKYVYVFYTVSSSEQRICRFNYDVATETGTGFTDLISGLPTKGQNHDGGGMAIGGDGKLYWSIGNNGNGFAVGENGNRAVMGSKVGRANLDGTAPSDNPYYNDTVSGAVLINGVPCNRYIFADGFRNPFTMTTHPVSGDIWIDVVGEGYEQVFLVKRGNHAGDLQWEDNQENRPAVAGATLITPKIKYRTNSTDTRSIVSCTRSGNVTTYTTSSRHGFRQGEKLTISGVADASFNGTFFVKAGMTQTTFSVDNTGANVSSTGGSAVTQGLGGCVTGGCFYNATQFPAPYQGAFFFGDYNSGKLNVATLDSAYNITSVDTFATGVTNCVDVNVGPGGDLYYMSHGGTIYRLQYTAQAQVAVPTITPNGGSFFGSTPVSLTTTTAGASIRYTTDGSTPSATAGTLYSGSFTLTSSATVKAIAYKSGMTNSTVSSASFNISALRNPENPSPTSAGLNYSYYEGSWSALPNFSAMTPLQTGVVANFSLTPRLHDDNFGFQFTGYVDVPTDGSYTFYTSSDDGSRLYIGTTLVVDNDGLHGTQEVAGTIGLKAGKHAIRVEFFEAAGGEALAVSYDGPGIAKQSIPDNRLFRTNPYGLDARANSPAYLNMPATETGTIPALLSQTGIFSNTASLIPNAGVIPYDVNSPLWSDGALKRRWISVPTSQTITFAATGEWTFPAGTVFVKHFELDTDEGTGTSIKRLETRVLVVKSDLSVYGVTYKWNAAGTDADLLAGGATDSITITQAGGGTRTQNWNYPSRTDCLTCHTASAKYVLGVKTRQLNGLFTYPATARSDNQLRTWNHLGYFNTPLSEASIPGYAHLVKVSDTSASLDERVRSYWDSNCAQCHRPGGAPTVMDFRYDTPLASQNVINGTVNNPLGIDNAKVVVPKDIWRSMLHKRMSLLGANQMSPLARNEVDQVALQTMADWINGLAGTAALAPPVINPNGGSFSGSVSVTLSHPDSGATIRYTLDNSDPTATSTAYSSPITLTTTTTLRARAFKSGSNTSVVAVATFTVGPVITVNKSSIALGSTPAGTASAAQNYTVSGSGLSANISITAPGGVELRNASGGGTYGSSVTLTSTGGVVNSTVIEVRIPSTATVGSITGNIVNASSGAASKNVAVSGTVTAVSGGGTGTILREYWTGIAGNAVSAIPTSTPPAGTSQLTNFEAPTDWADNYGTRVRGYIHPPASGAYTFWIASDDNGELWLSTDSDPAHKVLIASVASWTSPREWNKFPSQQSVSITLAAGQKYYIEALQKEGGGLDNLAVAWQGTGIAQQVIPGANLSPFVPGGFSAKINFQLVSAVTPAGYVADSGAAYGDRGNGFTYGWNIDNSDTARERNDPSSPDKRYDTLLHLQKPTNPNAFWEIAVPNGTYTVHAVSGDPQYIDSVFKLNVENVLVVDGTPTASTHWFEGTATVTVSDGRLTVSNGTGAANNKICYIEISPTSGAAAAKLTQPVVAALPDPWQNIDVGTVGVAGTANFINNVFMVKGSGTNLGGTIDAFQFVYRTLAGDGQLTARVASFAFSNTDAQAGIMMRDGTSTDAPFIMACVTPGGTTSIRRNSVGASANVLSKSTTTKAPCWVRVQRLGNMFSTWRSNDGSTWTKMEQVNLNMGRSVLIGMGVCSHNNSERATATFDGVGITP